MDLPSFLWLWRIAAWSMGLALLAYLLLAMSGAWLFYSRSRGEPRPNWIPSFHLWTGGTMIALVLLLLGIGLVGTLGHYGHLGHSAHLPVGVLVVCLTLLSGWSATQISPARPWARLLHVSTNLILLIGYIGVTLTGWIVVQKYL